VTTEIRRLAAILFSDICGYSRIMGSDEAQALAIVSMHNNCIEQAAKVHGGRIIKTMGDGVLAEFTSAVNAVQAAMDIQKAVSDHNAAAPDREKFQLRIGIHVGDVVVADGGDLFGDGVNVASRIQPLAEPGGICVSRDIFDLVNNKIAIQAVNLGPHELRNISRQIDIYEILVDAVARAKLSSASPAVTAARRHKRWLWTAAAILAAVAVTGAFLTVRKIRFANAAERFYSDTAAKTAELEGKGDLAGAIAALDAFPAIYRQTAWQPKIDAEKTRLEKLLTHHRTVREAEQVFNRLSAKAAELAGKGDLPGAISALEVYPAIHGQTEWKSKIDAEKFRLEELLKRQTLAQKKENFLTAMQNDDRAAALAMVHPDILQHADRDALWMRLKVMIEVWKDVPPLKWDPVRKDWFIHPDPPAPSDKLKGPRRPARMPPQGDRPPLNPAR